MTTSCADGSGLCGDLRFVPGSGRFRAYGVIGRMCWVFASQLVVQLGRVTIVDLDAGLSPSRPGLRPGA
ncbi:hypothetical protein [Streptomyces specialis]|uniref:hypothetical protein n=1 Tax=Streptomyces specialis TaxID=498367 RepID=UPI00073F27FD|nr:hypothetical protein [Streptomyces specialis]